MLLHTLVGSDASARHAIHPFAEGVAMSVKIYLVIKLLRVLFMLFQGVGVIIFSRPDILKQHNLLPDLGLFPRP